jgi:hypothetical protein
MTHPHKHTDPTQLTNMLLASGHPEDLHAVVLNFDQGNTPVRDIPDFTHNQRSRVLDIVRSGQTKLPAVDYRLLANSVKALGSYMHPDCQAVRRLRDHCGWEFLRRAGEHLTARVEWADRLNAVINKEHGISITGLLSFYRTHGHRRNADKVVAAVTTNERYVYNVAHYLAEESITSQQQQEHLFGEQLVRSQGRAIMQLHTIGAQTGLDPAHILRASRQIMSLTFGANNRLTGPQPQPDAVVLGNYRPGTLRLNVRYQDANSFEGIVFDPATILGHEVRHGSSAQSYVIRQNKHGQPTEIVRIGLRAADQSDMGHTDMGDEDNEGMSEFLNQLDLHGPDKLVRLATTGIATSNGFRYRPQVRAMAHLWHTKPSMFGALFNAYHGQVDSPGDLARSLACFEHTVNSLPPAKVA